VDAGVDEVDVALAVEVVNAAEVETHALGLRGERRGLAALGADLDHAEVAVEVVNAAEVETHAIGLRGERRRGLVSPSGPTLITPRRKSQKRLLLSTAGRLPAEIKF